MEIESESKILIDLFDENLIQTHWTNIHYTIWCNREDDLNLFFYHFHLPDEKLRTDEFSQEEIELLLQTLNIIFRRVQRESPCVSGAWGLFSMLIPYRNGAKCYDAYNKFKDKVEKRGSEEEKIELLKNSCKEGFFASEGELKNFYVFFKSLAPGFSENAERSRILLDELSKMQIDKDAILNKLRQLGDRIEPELKKLNKFKKCTTYKSIEQAKAFIIQRKKLEPSTQRQTPNRIPLEKSPLTAQSLPRSSSKKNESQSEIKIKREVIQTFQENCINIDDYDSEPDLARIFRKYAKKEDSSTKKVSPFPSLVKKSESQKLPKRGKREKNLEDYYTNSDDGEVRFEKRTEFNSPTFDYYSRVKSTKIKFQKSQNRICREEGEKGQLNKERTPKGVISEKRRKKPEYTSQKGLNNKSEAEMKKKTLSKLKDRKYLEFERQLEKKKKKNFFEKPREPSPFTNYFSKIEKEENMGGKRIYFEPSGNTFETNLNHLKWRKLSNNKKIGACNYEYETKIFDDSFKKMEKIKPKLHSKEFPFGSKTLNPIPNQHEMIERENSNSIAKGFFFNEKQIINDVNYFEIYGSLKKRRESMSNLFLKLFLEYGSALNKLNKMITFKKENSKTQIYFRKVELWELELLKLEIKKFEGCLEKMSIKLTNQSLFCIDGGLDTINKVSDIIINIFEKKDGCLVDEYQTHEQKLAKASLISEINCFLMSIANSIDFYVDFYYAWPSLYLLQISLFFLKNLVENEVFYAENAFFALEIQNISSSFDSVLLYLGICSVYSLCFKNDILRAEIYLANSGEEAIEYMVMDLVFKKIVILLLGNHRGLASPEISRYLYTESFELFSRAFYGFLNELRQVCSEQTLNDEKHNKKILKIREYMRRPGNLKGQFNLKSFIEIQKNADKQAIPNGFFPGLLAGVLNNHFNEDFFDEEPATFLRKFKTLLREKFKIFYIKELFHMILSQLTSLELIGSKLFDSYSDLQSEAIVLDVLLKASPLLLTNLELIDSNLIYHSLLNFCLTQNYKTSYFFALNRKLLKDLSAPIKLNEEHLIELSRNINKLNNIKEDSPLFCYPAKIFLICMKQEFGNRNPDNKEIKRLLGKITLSDFSKLELNSKEFNYFIIDYFLIVTFIDFFSSEDNLAILFSKVKSLVTNIETSCLLYKILMAQLHFSILRKMSDLFLNQNLSYKSELKYVENYMENIIEKVISSLLVFMENLLDIYRELAVMCNKLKFSNTDKDLLLNYAKLDKIIANLIEDLIFLSKNNIDLNSNLLALFQNDKMLYFFDPILYFYSSTRLKTLKLLERLIENRDKEDLYEKFIKNSSSFTTQTESLMEDENSNEIYIDEALEIHDSANKLLELLHRQFNQRYDKMEAKVFDSLFTCFKCQYDIRYYREIQPQYGITDFDFQKALLNCLACLIKQRIIKGNTLFIKALAKEFGFGSDYISFKEQGSGLRGQDYDRKYIKMNLIVYFHKKLLNHEKAKNETFMRALINFKNEADVYVENLLILLFVSFFLAKKKPKKTIFQKLQEICLFFNHDPRKALEVPPKRLVVLSFCGSFLNTAEELNTSSISKKKEFCLISTLLENFKNTGDLFMSFNLNNVTNNLFKGLKDYLTSVLKIIKSEFSPEMANSGGASGFEIKKRDIFQSVLYLNYKLLPIYITRMQSLETFFRELFAFLFGSFNFPIIMAKQISCVNFKDLNLEIQRPEVLLSFIRGKNECQFKYIIKFHSKIIDLGAKRCLLMDIFVSIVEAEIIQTLKESKKKIHNSKKFLLDYFEHVSKDKKNNGIYEGIDNIDLNNSPSKNFIELIRMTLICPRSYTVEFNKSLSPSYLNSTLLVLKAFFSDLNNIVCFSERKARWFAIVLHKVVRGILGCELLNNIIATDPNIQEQGVTVLDEFYSFLEYSMSLILEMRGMFYLEELSNISEAFTFFNLDSFICLIIKFDPLIRQKIEGDRQTKMKVLFEIPLYKLSEDERVSYVKRICKAQEILHNFGYEEVEDKAKPYTELTQNMMKFLSEKAFLLNKLENTQEGKEINGFIRKIS